MIKKIAICFFAISVLVTTTVLSVNSYHAINAAYPPAKRISVKMNEPLSYGGLEITVVSYQLYEFDEFMSICPPTISAEIFTSYFSKEDMSFAVVMVEISNPTEKEITSTFETAMIASSTYANAVDFEPFMEFNKDFNYEQKPGERQTLIMPYMMLKSMYLPSGQKPSDIHFQLIVSLYPERISFELD